MTINDRIEFIIKDKKLTANDFASKLGVRASNISHIVTGRNKPSFAFIEKLAIEFPEINPLWLLKGEGDLYLSNNTETKTENPLPEKDNKEKYLPSVIINTNSKEQNVPLQKNLFGDEEPIESSLLKIKKSPIQQKSLPNNVTKECPISNEKTRKIKNIIIYYSNDSFEEFIPKH
ncbi:MAG: helix-turn-helix transcriptional regulator [Bacteroidetes bacterium]|nr:helix-turn-helix transcriptional regulator [Bacteroidota bacterium]